MKGALLDFNIPKNEGLISGDDNRRYTFPGSEWREAEAPRRGMRVDFEGQGSAASGVFRDMAGAAAGHLQKAASDHQLTQFPVGLVILLHYITFGIFTFIHFNLMHGSLPKVRPDDPSAGKAIGFMFIPFFNFYWVFFSYGRLCLRVDEQRVQHGLPPSELQGLSIAMCILMVIPYIGIISWLVLAPIFFGMMRSSVNELVATPAPLAR